MSTLNDYAKIEVCRGDFYLMLQNAMLQAGGASDIGSLKKMTLEGVVNILAQNGIRMVYMPDRHMDAVRVSWENKKQPQEKPEPFSGRREDFDAHIKKKQKTDWKWDCDPSTGEYTKAPSNPPIKKQLLCDMRDADLDTSKDMDFGGGCAGHDCSYGNHG